MPGPSPEEHSRRWMSFGMGCVVEAVVLMLVLWLGTLLPSMTPQEHESKDLWSANVTLLTPVLLKPAQRSINAPVVKEPTPTPEIAVQAPKVVEPKPVTPPLVAKAHIPMEPPSLHSVAPPVEVSRPTLPKWEPRVQVGAFSGSASGEAKVRLPASKVQTGGFGSPSGLPGFVQGGSQGNVAHLGAFDLATGPGVGDRSGGAHGVQRRVAGSGFGDATVVAPSHGVPGGAHVASAGFGDVTAEAPTHGTPGGVQVASAGFADAQSLTHAPGQAQPQQAVASFDPVEIISKPNPVYSEEARRLHIQGEVLLRVIFSSSGRLQILGVARGLGHGLDQAAIQAAQQIQFKPARRNGRPENTAATLHILFELAA
ncbi:MAG TPA: TonB family protein [Terriglobia bacterium]|nr:TonB family protein [Terriglobia bacterium]